MRLSRRPRAATVHGLLAIVAVACLPGARPADAQRGHDMRLVGWHDLEGRAAYQPIVHEQMVGGRQRYIAYIGLHRESGRDNGTLVVDVTDPTSPALLAHVPGVGGAQMVRACSGDELPGARYPGRSFLLRANGNLEHQIFDVTDPGRPVLASTPVTGLNGTHKSYWECGTGIAYLVSGVNAGTTLPNQKPVAFQAWRTNRMTQVFDLSDPAHPVFIRNFGLDGQQPGATGPVPTGVHGCISAVGLNRERVYCGHGTSSHGIMAILDRRELLRPTTPLADAANPRSAELKAPLISRLETSAFNGAHTTFPVLGVEVAALAKDAARRIRDVVVVVNESTASGCNQARQLTFLVDVTDERHPWPVASYDVPEAEGRYCDAGGRFGAHASNESFTAVFYRRLVFIAWFNAGVRAVDIRDPFNPREAAYYVPRPPAGTGSGAGPIATQTNNVEVDDRGLIYIVDRANAGLHILELTGEARKIANRP